MHRHRRLSASGDHRAKFPLAPFALAGFDSIDCMVCDEAPDGPPAALVARERVEIIC